ncbi:MAG TPA: hypothetical protein VGA04_01285, partial [Streptosporangiaceae bacterium]
MPPARPGLQPICTFAAIGVTTPIAHPSLQDEQIRAGTTNLKYRARHSDFWNLHNRSVMWFQYQNGEPEMRITKKVAAIAA